MSIRMIAGATALALVSLALPGAAYARDNTMKECGTEYQAAKAANTLNGQKWNDYLADCRKRHAAATPATTPAAPATAPAAAAAPPAAVKPAAPATTTAATTTETKPASGGREAMLARERACGAEWKAQKVELRKTTPDLKWPKFWSECNTRMKAAGK